MRRILSLLFVLDCCLAPVAASRSQSIADPDRWQAEQTEAVEALEQGRFNDAVALFQTAAQHAAKFGTDDLRLAESLNGLARAYRYLRDYSEAEPPARRALAILERSLGPSDKGLLPSLINLSGIAQSTEQYEEAEQIYRRMLCIRWGTSDTPGNEAGAVLEQFAEILSLGYTRDPGLKTALEAYWQSITEVRLDKSLYGVMRDGLLSVRLVSAAESLMGQATRLYPNSRQLRYQFAELYVKSEKYLKALRMFEQAAGLESHSESAVERTQLGLIYEKIAAMNIFLVRFDDALAALRKALTINPDSVSSGLLLGALYLRRNEFDKAASEYRHLITLDPRIAAAHDGLAQVDLSIGQFPEAVREAKRALEIDPLLQRARYVLGMALVRSGRGEAGQEVLQEYRRKEAQQQAAAAAAKEVEEIVRAVSAALIDNRLPDALELLRDGTRRHPEAATLYLKQGLIQGRLGLHDEAIETFETMGKLHLDDFLVHRNLAGEYEAVGNAGARQQRVLYLQRYDAALQASVNR